ncbi:SDR family oxidoreductase [Emcibacter sp. SYSU 3D8]|uniref:SDR family oxidoreductase n=1 Tax=Emcibacter sp. SYSU 3D8 TaxID=3133969 RepID=UPI0031FECA46
MSGQRTVLVLGGTSDIGFAIARRYAEQGWTVLLAARDADRAERNANDLRLRYRGEAVAVAFDALSLEFHARFLDGLGMLPDTAVCVIGVLGDQARAEADPDHAAAILRANFEGPALLLGEIARRMAARGRGTIVGVSSVAGDRGRGSNYVYGSAKAGLTAFLSGLRNRFAGQGVHVMTVKPGFVRTAMTEGMKLPGQITAEPGQVGRAVYRAAEKSRRNVIYVLPVWRLIMLIIGHIPEFLFKKLKL